MSEKRRKERVFYYQVCQDCADLWLSWPKMDVCPKCRGVKINRWEQSVGDYAPIREPEEEAKALNLHDGDEVWLIPLPDNPLHGKPIKAIFSGGYFYCEGTDPTQGPDYYLGDVLKFNEGFAQEPDGEDGS